MCIYVDSHTIFLMFVDKNIPRRLDLNHPVVTEQRGSRNTILTNKYEVHIYFLVFSDGDDR